MTTDTPTRPLALVTGASTGIGRELARQLAERGHDVVLVADEPAVQEAAAELPGSTRAVVADLTDPAGVQEVESVLSQFGRAPDVVALNAGVGANGRFDEIPLEDDLRVVQLNVVSTVHLAKLVLRQMVAAGRGRLLVTSSIAASAPGPFHTTYAASKAFLQSFAQALRVELEDTGVSVTALMPGPTDTEFFERADMQDTKVASGKLDDPADVARDGLDALFAGKDHVVAGSVRNSLQVASGRVLREPTKARMQSKQTEPGSASD